MAVNNWLFYATGGLALTKLEGDFGVTDGNGSGFVTGLVQGGRAHDLKTGYAVGAGGEAGLTDQVSLKAEYLFVDFGRLTGVQTSNDLGNFSPPATQNFTESILLNANRLRVGLGLRFGGPDAPSSRGGLMSYAAPTWTVPPVSSTLTGSSMFDRGCGRAPAAWARRSRSQHAAAHARVADHFQ